MAGESGSSAERSEAFRWWFLPSWLGLDAPCVVLTWTWAIGRNFEIAPSFRPAAAMFLFVWSIYLLDRMIDVARCSDWQRATGRLHFGRRHRSLFVACLSLCAIGLVVLLSVGLPADLIRRATYVALGLTAHFLAFIVPVFSRGKLSGKEFSVGLFFALGAYAFLGFAPGMLPLLVSVAVLISFNCFVIAAKDAECDRANDPGGASRWWRTMNRDLLCGGVALMIAFGLGAFLSSARAFYGSIAGAFFGLTLLHWQARRFSGDALRALADFALFTPVLAELTAAVRNVMH
jgi:hypothetical protein